MYTELPLIETSTPATRLQALKDAKSLTFGNSGGGLISAFVGDITTPGAAQPVIEGWIRLAEYITTGHDYRDTHPEGKRRPVINQTHVTVVAPPGVDTEDLEHFLHHVENGDFTDFLKDAMKDADAQHEAAADEAGDTHLTDEEREAGLDGK